MRRWRTGTDFFGFRLIMMGLMMILEPVITVATPTRTFFAWCAYSQLFSSRDYISLPAGLFIGLPVAHHYRQASPDTRCTGPPLSSAANTMGFGFLRYIYYYSASAFGARRSPTPWASLFMKYWRWRCSSQVKADRA